MTQHTCQALQLLLDNTSNKKSQQLTDQLNNLPLPVDQNSNINALISIYNNALLMFSSSFQLDKKNEETLDLYHKTYQELESIIALSKEDKRHNFIVVIPVADRPKHLKACLASLFELCEKFSYGGFTDNQYQKIQVIVADDSKAKICQLDHEKISNEYTRLGLKTTYFSQQLQYAQLESLDDSLRSELRSVLGQNAEDSFYHKGASIMRNIVYLKLNEMLAENQRQLVYFIDSDQEFKVKVPGIEQDKNLYLVNYFYELDKIFTEKNINILTGKVVGDPPVSPAVMAGNFLDDVIGYLNQLANIQADTACEFHPQEKQQVNDASYHDMAELFGFKQKTEAYAYNCTLQGAHNNADCFSHFSTELNRFFYGEHPTRKMYYEYEDALSSVKAARTVYTGNYVINAAALKYFIPFATLKLRMAGPVLGRIIKSELADSFVSANLPMLHKRTYEETGVSEFRSGIDQNKQAIDLSGEFERQYFGDVMLFTIEKLTEAGFPQKNTSVKEAEDLLLSVEREVNLKYKNKQKDIQEKLSQLKLIFTADNHWWNQGENYQQIKDNLQSFINNIELNFSETSKGAELINSETHKAERIAEMKLAISEYMTHRESWSKALAKRH